MGTMATTAVPAVLSASQLENWPLSAGDEPDDEEALELASVVLSQRCEVRAARSWRSHSTSWPMKLKLGAMLGFCERTKSKASSSDIDIECMM